ncbi:hypothetical protein NFI96_029636, partial [Prochilodus magdalenae]
SFISGHRTLLIGRWPQGAAHKTLPTGHCPTGQGPQDAAPQDAAHRTLPHRTLPIGRCPTGPCPTGRGPQGAAHRTLSTGRGPQDAAHRTLPTGHHSQDAGHRTLPTGRCPQDAANRTLPHRTVPTGHCQQDAAHRTLPTGRGPQDAVGLNSFGWWTSLSPAVTLSTNNRCAWTGYGLDKQVSGCSHISVQALLPQGAEGSVLKDDDVLQNLPGGTAARLYFRDLGPQLGWTMVFMSEYVGPLLIYLLFYVRVPYIYTHEHTFTSSPHPVVSLACACHSFHYIKRLVETIFVHRFSHGTMPLRTMLRCVRCWCEWIRHSSANGHLSVTTGLGIAQETKLSRQQRPVGQRPVGQRPVGSVLWGSVLWAASCGAASCGAGSCEQRPVGQRPVGSVLWGSVLWGRVLWAASCGAASCEQRPVGQRPVGRRHVTTDEGLEDDQHCTNCAYYWGFSAWLAYYINHPLYTPPCKRLSTHSALEPSHFRGADCGYQLRQVQSCSNRAPSYGETQITWALVLFVLCEAGNFSIHWSLNNLLREGGCLRKDVDSISTGAIGNSGGTPNGSLPAISVQTGHSGQQWCALGSVVWGVRSLKARTFLSNPRLDSMLSPVWFAGPKCRRFPHPSKNPFTWLFFFVSCPNYTYEVGVWVSFSIMTQCVPVALFTLLGFVQMTIWAKGKHKAYTREFKDYPTLRMPILPFIL